MGDYWQLLSENWLRDRCFFLVEVDDELVEMDALGREWILFGRGWLCC